jgi:hypothetical protein
VYWTSCLCYGARTNANHHLSISTFFARLPSLTLIASDHNLKCFLRTMRITIEYLYQGIWIFGFSPAISSILLADRQIFICLNSWGNIAEMQLLLRFFDHVAEFNWGQNSSCRRTNRSVDGQIGYTGTKRHPSALRRSCPLRPSLESPFIANPTVNDPYGFPGGPVSMRCVMTTLTNV